MNRPPKKKKPAAPVAKPIDLLHDVLDEMVDADGWDATLKTLAEILDNWHRTPENYNDVHTEDLISRLSRGITSLQATAIALDDAVEART